MSILAWGEKKRETGGGRRGGKRRKEREGEQTELTFLYPFVLLYFSGLDGIIPTRGWGSLYSLLTRPLISLGSPVLPDTSARCNALPATQVSSSSTNWNTKLATIHNQQLVSPVLWMEAKRHLRECIELEGVQVGSTAMGVWFRSHRSFQCPSSQACRTCHS